MRFIHPFATAHGERTGTDSVFVQVQAGDVIGHGEATLPPYLKETATSVVTALEAFTSRPFGSVMEAVAALDDDRWNGDPAFRNAVYMALCDIESKVRQLTLHEFFEYDIQNKGCMLMTIGISSSDELEQKIAALPEPGGFKVKVDRRSDELYIRTIKALSNKPLFIDANQGLPSIDRALQLIGAAGDGILGMEQPFARDRMEEHARLTACAGTTVYGDESIQDLADLKRVGAAFNGVNVKLMKCGGLDRAADMIDKARRQGKRVMLGSMSESALGCTAMAHFAGVADLIDLDGPWLLSNDPFQGIGIHQGRLQLPQGPGIGAVLRADLTFTPIGV